jgi:nucleolar protein 4
LKQFRLIVRNLPFSATLADIETAFAKFGPLFEVSVPPGTKASQLNRGFAFVNYTNINDARKAVEGMNMKPIKGRLVAVDFAVSKEQYKNVEQSSSSSTKLEQAIEGHLLPLLA